MNNKDFESLKVGDKVIVHGNLHDDRVATIDRITNTQFVIGPYKFRRSDGWRVGAWTNGFISIATPEKIAEIEHRQRMSGIRNYVTKHLSEFNDAQLEAMYRAIKDNKNKNGTEQ